MFNGFTRDVPITLSTDTIKPTNADRFRAMSDKEIVEFLASVFCAGMSAEEHGDDFLHSFPWTLDRLRQPGEAGGKS